MRKRDAWFDNYKALLIILVVVGHFIEPLRDDHGTVNDLYFIIYSFHMPAFIMISGYFSKKKVPLMKEVKTLLVPYLIFQFSHYILYNLVLEESKELHLFQPHFTLWYIFCLFVWKFITPYVTKIKYIFPIAVVFGMTIGVDSTMGTLMSISRIIVYYPFFLLGYYADKERVAAFFHNRIWKVIAGSIVAGYGLLIYFVVPNDDVYNKFVSCRYCYEELELNAYEGTLLMGAFYLVALVLTISVGLLISSKVHWFTYLGQRTMSIYLFHGLIQRFLLGYTDIYDEINTHLEVGELLAFSVVLTFVLSFPVFMSMVKKLSNLKIERILKEE
ncbi:putative membrane protein [Lachnospiraceae bacterium KM106-2]|nr:putative membrane protein [Lachnospiraceae bacterium KM106-2]